MSRFVLTMVFGIIALILGFFSAIVEKNKWLLRFLAFLSLIVGVGNLLVTTNMPSPQLYMTNGDKESNNELYFEVEWPFSVYYTLLPYENPKENGVKYEEPIKLNESVSVGYVPSFLGIIWGDTMYKDIVLKSDGKAEATDTKIPGTAIAEIKGYLTSDKFFPGDEITKDDFSVYGVTIAGEEVRLEQYDFLPNIVKSGRNEININYNDLICEINFVAQEPVIEYITAEYVGGEIETGASILKEDIQVTAFYNDGHTEMIDNFQINPLSSDEPGELEVTISYGEYSDTVAVVITSIEENETDVSLFVNCYEKHEPDGIAPQIGFGYWDSEKQDVQGQSYDDKQLYLFIGDMFNRIQNTGDSFITVTIHYIVNPEYNLTGGIHVKGKFVVEGESMGSSAYTDVSIKVDGKDVWNAEEKISGSMIKPMPFDIEMGEGDTEMTMVFDCNALEDGLGLGIIFDEVTKS